MAAKVKEIEDAIIAKLTASFPELTVEAFPERPEEYDLLHPLGAVLVQYDGSQYSGNRISNGAVASQRTLRFSVILLMRNLRSSNGCYEMLDRGQQSLCGLCIPGTLSPLIINNEGIISENDGVWMWSQSYTVTTSSVAAPHR